MPAASPRPNVIQRRCFTEHPTLPGLRVCRGSDGNIFMAIVETGGVVPVDTTEGFSPSCIVLDLTASSFADRWLCNNGDEDSCDFDSALTGGATLDITFDDIVCDTITGADTGLSIAGLAGGPVNVAGTVGIVGGAGSPTFVAGGQVSLIGGAGATIGSGGAAVLQGGASGAGATGNGGDGSVVGGQAVSTDGNGGAGAVVGGLASGTGTGGLVSVVGGASGGAGGTAGSASVDAGAANGGTPGNVTIGGTNAALVNIGKVGGTTTLLGSVSIFGAGALLPSSSVDGGAGAISSPSTGSTYVGVVRQSRVTLAFSGGDIITVPDGGQSVGTQLMQFPAGHILILGAVLDSEITTNNVYNASPNDQYFVSVGTTDGTQAADEDLTAGEQDVIPKTTLDTVSSTTLTHAVEDALTTPTAFDGTVTPVKLYANIAVPAAAATAPTTHDWTGTLVVTWVNLGDIA